MDEYRKILKNHESKTRYHILMTIGAIIIFIGLLGLFSYTSLLFLILPGLFISGYAADAIEEENNKIKTINDHFS